MKEKCILGLDIGIGSVGWAVVGIKSHEIIDAGVRMFPGVVASQNQIRKNYRGIRRNNRRLQNRLRRLENLLSRNNIEKPVMLLDNPIELRVKGLKKKLTKEELYVVLYNLVKYRGVSYLEDMNIDEKSLKKLKRKKNLYPCIIQKERLEKYGVYRGINMIEGETFINTFTTDMYEKEAVDIMIKQEKFHPQLNETFRADYIEILRSKREFYTGPGNELSRTNYGIYKTDGTTLDYLYDEFRGACSIYNGKHGMDRELRASWASYSAQYYNVLNDLCNIKVDGWKLSRKEKVAVMEVLKEYKVATTITKVLKKLYDIPPEQVTGYRIDRNGKETNHCFQVHRAMKKDLALEDIDISKYSKNTLDAIADILTLNAETEGILNHFNNKDRAEYIYVKDLSSKEIKAFIKLKQHRKELFSKWSSFSYRVLGEICPEMLRSGHEQYTCIKKLALRQSQTKENKSIDYRSIVDEIYNPTLARSVTQAIKILNKLMKQYEFVEIIIEMPKDNSLEEQKSNIAKLHKQNENFRMMALSFAGIKESEIDTRKDKRIIQKLKLYYQQRGRCLYSGREIDVKKLLEGTMDYEVDHIIPMSVSFDDSMANKVLVESEQNRKKSNMTPFHYLNQSTDTWEYSDYKAYVLGLRRDRLINNTKKDNFLMEEDIKKQDVIRAYINKNTNDTRYISKIINTELDRYFIGNKMKVNVKVINGAITNQLKKATFEYKRNWQEDFKNYGYNAMICCYTGLSLRYYHDKFINVETGQILNREALENLDKEEKAGYLLLSGWEIKTKMLKYNSMVKISHKIDTKVNRLISDQTIYGTREVDGEFYVVHKIKNIYDNKEYQRLKKKLATEKEKFLMYQNDYRTWQKLEEIIEMYPQTKGSPFKEHMKAVGPLRKYAKKGDGPVITELKYLGNRVGKGLDITHKYPGAKNKVVMESLKQFRGDVYYDKNEHCYNIVPVRYADFSIQKNQYILQEEAYEKLLRSEELIKDGQSMVDLEKNGHEFCFSLYKNSIIGIEQPDTKEIEIYRYHGKNHSLKNRFEYKRIDGVDVSRKYITFNRNMENCFKYNVDILGNYYKIQREDLKMSFTLDNEMIG